MKQCPKCRYFGNENDAHFCVKCGAVLTPGESWRVYDSSVYSLVSGLTERLNEKRLKDKDTEIARLQGEITRLKSSVSSSESTVRRLRSELAVYRNKKSLWQRISDYIDNHDWALLIVCCLGAALFIGGLLFLVERCSESDKPKEITIERYEKNGKWGLKEKDGNTLLTAEYDNIYSSSNPRYWYLNNGSKWGLAYRSDSNFVITDPVYDWVRVGTGKLAAYKRDNNQWQMVRNGLDYNSPQDEIVFLKGGNYVSGRKGDGFKITNELSDDVVASGYKWMHAGNDSTIVASYDESAKTRFLLDQNGKKVSDTFVWPFSNWEAYEHLNNGVQWVALNEKNNKDRIFTLIDDRGNKLFTTPMNSNVRTANFYNALYRPDNGNAWIALNHQGKEVFRLTCDDLDFFNRGVARFKRNNKYGFVDKDGKVVVPAEYYYADTYFKEDSTMRASKNGKWGTLRIDGTFTPDKK